jgi:hypothetical protein
MKKTIFLSTLLFMMIVTLINCGVPEVEIPPYTPSSEKPIIAFCGTGKSYLDLPSPLLDRLKKLANEKNGLPPLSVEQYEFEGSSYFLLKISYSSYDIDGLYSCNGENFLSGDFNNPETPFTKKFRMGKKFTQIIYSTYPK